MTGAKHKHACRVLLNALRVACKVVVDRGLGLVAVRALVSRIRTAVAMHACSARAASRHSPCERRSCELAQQANIAANSVAHGAESATLRGRTLSLSIFMSAKSTLIIPRGACYTPTKLYAIADPSEMASQQPLSQAQLAALASRNSSTMRCVSMADQPPRCSGCCKQAVEYPRRWSRRKLKHDAPSIHGRQQGPQCVRT